MLCGMGAILLPVKPLHSCKKFRCSHVLLTARWIRGAEALMFDFPQESFTSMCRGRGSSSASTKSLTNIDNTFSLYNPGLF